MVSRSTSPQNAQRRPARAWRASSRPRPRSLRLRRARSAPRRGPLRPLAMAYWLLAALLLPAASVAGVLWLIGPLGYAVALAVIAVADVALLGAAARAAGPGGAAVRVAGGIVLTVLVTWAALALGFVVLASSCHGCLS